VKSYGAHKAYGCGGVSGGALSGTPPPGSAGVSATRSQLTQALMHLKQLPETLERAQHELAIQLALGSALLTTQGHAAPETG
jgi:hypothetical protein